VALQSLLQGSSQQAIEQNEMMKFLLRAHAHGISPSVFSNLLSQQSTSSSSSEGELYICLCLCMKIQYVCI